MKFLNQLAKESVLANRRNYSGDSWMKTLLIISEVQILSMIINLQANLRTHQKDSDPFSPFVKSVTNIFIGENIIENFEKGYLVYLSWIILICIIIILKILYRNKSSSNNLHGLSSRILEFNEAVLFIYAENGMISHINTTRSVYSFIGLISLLIITGLTILASNYHWSLNNKVSLRSNKLPLLNLGFKFIFLLISTTCSKNFQSALLTSLILIFSSYKIRYLFQEFPFYAYPPQKVVLVFSSISFLWGLFTLALVVMPTSSFTDIMYIEMLSLIFIIKSISLKSNNLKSVVYGMDSNLFKTPTKIFEKIAVLSELRNKSSIVIEENEVILKNEALMLLNGVKNRQEVIIDSGPMTKDKFAKKIELIIKLKLDELLQNGINKFPQSNDLKMYYCSFLLEEKNEFLKPYKILSSISQSSLDPIEEIKYRELKKEIEKKLLDSKKAIEGENFIKTDKIIEVDNLLTRFIASLKEIVFDYFTFWTMYMSPDLSMKNLSAQNVKIEVGADKIEKEWKFILQEYPKNLDSFVPLYYNYLLLIRNLPSKANQINRLSNKISSSQKKANGLFEKFTNENFFDPENVVLRISTETKTAGTILSASKSISSELGWIPEECIGKNIAIFMPNILASVHGAIMRDFEFSESNITKSLSAVCKLKNGFLKKFNLLLTIYPHITENLSCLLVLKRVYDYEPFCLLNGYGKIEGHDKPFSDFFKLSGKKDDIDSLFEDLSLKFEDDELNYKKQNCQKNYSLFHYLKEKGTVKFSKDFEQEEKQIFQLNLQEKILRDITYYSVTLSEVDFDFEFFERDQNENPIFSNESLLEIPYEMNGPAVNPTHFISNKEIESTKSFLKLPYSKKAIEETQSKTNRETNLKNQSNRGSFRARSESKFSKDTSKEGYKENKGNKVKMDLTKKYETSSISSAGSRTSNSQKIEVLIHSAEPSKQTRALLLIGIIFVFISGFLIVLFQILSKSSISRIKGEIDVISSCSITQRELTRLSRLVMAYPMVDSGLWADDRYSYANVTSVRELRHKQLPGRAIILIHNRNLIRNSLYKLEKNFQDIILNKKFELKDRDEMVKGRTTHSFDFISEIYDSVLRIVQVPYDEVSEDNLDVQFILKNSFNDLLLDFEEIFRILLQDIYFQLDDNIIKSKTFAIIIGILAALVFSIVIFDTLSFIKLRDIFISILLSLDQAKIQTHILEVQKYITSLSDSTKSKKTQAVQNYREKKSSKAKTRNVANQSRLNQPVLFVLLATAGWISIFLIPFIALIFLSSSYNNLILSAVSDETQVIQTLYELDLLVSSFYFNMTSGPNTLVRNIPVVDAIDDYYDLYASKISFFRFLAADHNEESIKKYVAGDLCALGAEIQTQFDLNVCYSLGNGILRRGLTGIIEHNSLTFKTMIIAYENSDHSIQAKQTVVLNKLLIDSEVMINFMMLTGMGAVQSEIHDSILSLLDSYFELLQVITTPVAIFIILIGIFIWWKIYSALIFERLSWRKMCRQIPYSLVVNNKMLMSFMMRNLESKN